MAYPRPEQPPADQSAASRAYSRFVEGSMNDRISNAPPPTFLGPEEMATYERQFYDDSNHTRSRPTSGSEQSFNRNAGSKFWEGIRDKFTRTKSSSSSLTTVSSGKAKSSNRFSQQSQLSHMAASAPNEKENVSGAGHYPSREEVMENYKNLVEAGFFSSHAIQGTRHKPPPSGPAPNTDQPLPAPPPPTRDAPPTPFSQLVAQKQRKLQRQSQTQDNPATPALSSIFASIPYSATQPSPTGDAPLTTHARPDPRPPISLPKKYRRPGHPTTYLVATAPPSSTSPNRGTKRAVADMTGGSVDREMTDAATTDNNIPAEVGARKLVKKLRKSASRISVDLSLRPGTTRAGNAKATVHNNHPYGSAALLPSGGSTKHAAAPGAASSTSVDLVPRPPMSAAAAGRTVGSVVRSLSNSFRRDGGGGSGGGRMAPAASDDDLPTLPSAAAGIPSLPRTTATTSTNRLVKGKRSLVRRVSLGRPRSTSTSAPSVPPPRAELAPPASTTTTRPPPPDEEGDPMVLDDPPPEEPDRRDPDHPEPATARHHHAPSRDVQQPPGPGLGVPSFHYPQRRKNAAQPQPQPLAVLPAANTPPPPPPPPPPASRVAAASDAAGAGGGHVKGAGGSFCFGPLGAAGAGGAVAMGEGEGKENGEFAVF